MSSWIYIERRRACTITISEHGGLGGEGRSVCGLHGRLPARIIPLSYGCWKCMPSRSCTKCIISGDQLRPPAPSQISQPGRISISTPCRPNALYTHPSWFPTLVRYHVPDKQTCIMCLPLALKVPAARHDSDALVHGRLAHPEVAVDPLADAGRVGEGFGFQARAGVRSEGLEYI